MMKKLGCRIKTYFRNFDSIVSCLRYIVQPYRQQNNQHFYCTARFHILLYSIHMCHDLQKIKRHWRGHRLSSSSHPEPILWYRSLRDQGYDQGPCQSHHVRRASQCGLNTPQYSISTRASPVSSGRSSLFWIISTPVLRINNNCFHK